MNRTPHIRRNLAVAGAIVLAAAGPLAACGSDDSSSSDTTEADSGSSSAAVTVSDSWARTGTAGGNTAIYMVLTGGDESDSLVGVSVPTDVAATAELHETVAASSDEGDTMEDGEMGDAETDTTDMGDMDSGEMDSGDMDSGDMDSGEMDGHDGGGMMSMQPVDSIEIPAGENVELEPGGYHIMVLDLAADLVAGDTVEVTLTFDSGETQKVDAEVKES
ncbi:MAG: copper chaperone PCu(A)C [Microthrixaceae bacterium]|nr:copper chaperone PCu(A)C [Microthrixaceae bacterium]